MAPGAGDVRMGGAYIDIRGDSSQLDRDLTDDRFQTACT